MGNLCFSPVHGNTKTDVLTFTNTFYYIGHFSKFIRPGAKRISSVSSSNSVIATAFKNKNDTIAIIAMNTADTPLEYTITIDLKTAKLKLAAHSIQTIVLN